MNEDHYIKKIDRITSILVQLQSKPIVRAQDLADKFEVSVRTIYRDIKTLENAGIPIFGEAGSGYSLVDGYKLPPVMFTKEEVLSFITAEKLMQNFSHESLGSHYNSAMEKVKSVLRNSEKNLVTDIENQINIYAYQPEQKDSVKNIIPTVLESISEKMQLKIDYQNANLEASERTIEAVGIFYEFNYWYVMAFCTMRKDYRQFRVDRILKITKTKNPFSQEYGHINDYKNNTNGKKTEVKLLVEKKIMTHLVNSKKYYGLTKEIETENGIELIFETEWIDEGFPRWLITFADYAEIIYPESLKITLKNLINNISERIKI
ncbi:helix-turn-helix transcriptional regulator [Epilithonimonas sp. UC225_85]|uniref:helix-turn-helix transcriptional regulator n=1 Tax=Epilithonimonas sp. UC225_85 TaxID=3350167 RepID=UPI0036D37DA5